MKTIAEIAYDVIVAADLVPVDQIGIQDAGYSDWDGKRIAVIEEETTEVEESQFGPISQTTPLVIRACADSRSEAITLCHEAATAVYRYLVRLQHDRKSGVLAVTRTGQGDGVNTQSTMGNHEASRTFHVLNTINL